MDDKLIEAWLLAAREIATALLLAVEARLGVKPEQAIERLRIFETAQGSTVGYEAEDGTKYTLSKREPDGAATELVAVRDRAGRQEWADVDERGELGEWQIEAPPGSSSN